MSEGHKEENMSRKKRLASVTSAGLVFAMLLGQSSVANLGAEVVKAAECTENWVDTNYVVNGDFEAEANEDGSITGWTQQGDGVFSLETNEWMSNNLSQYLHLYSEAGENVQISQKIANLQEGTYRVVYEIEGGTNSSGLKISYADTEKDLPETKGFNEWQTVEADEFTISETTDVTISFSGDIAAGYWGDIDNVKLQKLDETTSDDKDDSEENQEGYKISVDKTDVTVEKGEKVELTAKVTYNGEELTEISDGIKLWWWVDTWNDHADGLSDGTLNNDDNSGKTLKADYTTKSVGTYYVVAKLQTPDGDVSSVVTITSKEPENTDAVENDDITVAKVKDLSSDFIMGMDISSVISEFKSGVVYKDYDGNKIDNVTDFCKFLADNGINHIRVRVWNDPYDSNGNGYGGGNNDVDTAKKIADACRTAGIKMLVDFHCSDFWADPGKQQAPKAWKNYTLEQKENAVKSFIEESLNKIDPQKDVVDMVQVGNETTKGFVGETEVENMCKLFTAGSEGVKTYNENVKVVIHVTNPEELMVTTWAKNLDEYKVNYDILATSYYPYWHGSLDNLKSEFKKVKKTYGKDVMVAETSYSYTLENSDGHDNTVRKGNNDDRTTNNCTEPFSVQGQATSIRNLIEAVNEAGGLGVYYWEPAWLTVGDTTGLTGDEYDQKVVENKIKWEKYGSGWASSYSGEYDANDAGKWYGGSAVDNEAMFYPDGTPTAGLKVWNYVKTGAVATKTGVENIENASVTGIAGQDIILPEKVNVTYNTETVAEDVTWNTDGVDFTKKGTYEVDGTVNFSRTIDRGSYCGKTSANVTCKVIVKETNLIEDSDDAGFEKADNFITDSTIVDDISYTKSDFKSGKACAHWYNGGSEATEATITYDKEITLTAGEYIFEYVAQGYSGENESDQVYAKVVDADGNVIAQGENVTLEGWKNWKYPTVSFKLDKETSVKLVVGIVSAAGGWGTADDMYLYQTKAYDSSSDDKKADDSKNPGNVVDPDQKDDNDASDKDGKIDSGDEDSNDNTSTDNSESSNSTSYSTTTTDKTLVEGSVLASTGDSKTTVKDTTTAKAAKTSDENNMYMWLVLAMAGIGVTIAVAIKKKTA